MGEYCMPDLVARARFTDAVEFVLCSFLSNIDLSLTAKLEVKEEDFGCLETPHV
jgi:hypothetical protein